MVIDADPLAQSKMRIFGACSVTPIMKQNEFQFPMRGVKWSDLPEFEGSEARATRIRSL